MKIEAMHEQAKPQAEENSRNLIAPWWHTALVVLLIAATSIFGSLHSAKRSMSSHHLANYAVTIAWEWILAAIVLWGTRVGKTPLRELLGQRRKGIKELAVDIVVALLFWFSSLVVLASIAVLLRLFHLENAQKQISQLAPSSLAEAALWITLSISAGICEEFVFRGYLQRQFARASGKLWIGVVVSAVLFGSAHGYEGIAGMLLITAYGALFSMLAIHRGSLRAGMIAHAWHDSIIGIALWILKRANVPLGIA
jgi:membrane protease YdiL (CAAX protease family)